MVTSRPVTVIGIAGGSGSGKSTLTRRLLQSLGPDQAVALSHDDYYRCLGALPHDVRARQNFDAPEALESSLLTEHLRLLRQRRPIDVPRYDFALHVRRSEVTRVEPRHVVLVEGIMLFHESSIREQLSLRIYVDATEEVRLNRRIERDQSERGRSRESVIQQWAASVKPMHDCFVEPTKVYASDVLTMDGSREAEAQAEQLIAKLRELIC